MNRFSGGEEIMNRSAFYVFDIARLKSRIKYLRGRLPHEVRLCYAVKANPFVVGEIGEELDRFEICSPGEANICSSLGIKKNKMVISGVYKTPEVIEKMVSDADFDGFFTVESLLQFALLRNLSEKYKKQLRILLRLTNDSQFGINESDIKDIIRAKSEYPFLRIRGIQFFSGTQKTSVKKLKREIEHLDDFIISLKNEYGFEAEELEYGPGFPVSYFVSESLDEDELLRAFSQLITDMKCGAEICLELGRSIAACCGRYYSHIVDIKCNKGQNYALVDGGMHHIVYFGQQMAMKQPVLSVVGKSGINEDRLWTICGSLCSMNDIIAKQIHLPDIAVGDVLCFENTGAYCMTEGTALFLSRDLPAVFLLTEAGDAVCVRRPFETEELNMPKYERSI